MKKNKTCPCGQPLEEKVGTTTHRMFQKDIQIHDVPFYQCTSCGDSFYAVSEHLLSQMLFDAYLSKTTDVRFAG